VLAAAAAAAAAAGAGVASAQTPCGARVRELADPTARAQLSEMHSRGASVADVIADGAECGRDTAHTPLTSHALHVLSPMVSVQSAGGVPDSRNEGGVWAGLGLTAFTRFGATFDRGMFHAVLAPEFWYAQNTNFNFYPGADGARSQFASNWYTPPYSIDLPTRFGESPLANASLGQSALWVSEGGADLGVSNSSQSWGPGIRGHLLLGPDAPGIPRVFVRTNHPIVTRTGAWSGTAFVGTLTESPFFDHNPANDLRTLTAWTIGWSPSAASGTSIGIAHASMRTGSLFGGSAHKLTGPSDQINTLYARAQAPDNGVRAWVEIGRAGALPSFRQFMTIPYQGITYLFGLEQAIKTNAGTLLLTGEAADLEQPTDIRGQPTQDFYTSNDIPQGWTQRGQLLGDGIGPGGQSQWFSIDWVTPSGSAGAFIERVRWNEDAFLRQYLPFPNRHDVTVRAGIRGGVLLRGQELHVELSSGRRLDYLFQNGSYIQDFQTVDVNVTQFRVSVTPFAERRP